MSVECVNACKVWKGDVSSKYDCSTLSCPSRATRVLSGFLASTAHAGEPIFRRNRVAFVSLLCSGVLIICYLLQGSWFSPYRLIYFLRLQFRLLFPIPFANFDELKVLQADSVYSKNHSMPRIKIER